MSLESRDMVKDTEKSDQYFWEDDVDGRARVTTDEEWVLQERWNYEVMKLWRLSNCENFVDNREEFVFDAFSDSEPVGESVGWQYLGARKLRSAGYEIMET